MDKKFEILNYDELPKLGKGKNAKKISWKDIKTGFILKTKHIKYGDKNYEFVGYDGTNQKIYLKLDGVDCKPINSGSFLSGRIGGLIISKKPYETQNFKIHTCIPMSYDRVIWEDMKEGTLLRTEHSRYGYNEFKFIKCEGGKGHKISIKFKDKIYRINSSNFLKGKIGVIVGVFSSEFKIEIGQIFKDNKRDLTIIDRKVIKGKNGQLLKYYKYKCNKCGFDCGEHYKKGKFNNEFWIIESAILTKTTGCSCCCLAPKIVVPYINSMWKTDYWMVELGVDEEWAKTHTANSEQNALCKCPNCGNLVNKKCCRIFTNKTISCKKCGDGISYPEKFIYSTLKQLNLGFTTQLSKTTFKWCDKYKYDFYIPSLNCIIEAHGEQHYRENNRGRTLQEEQENDKIKRELALNNGIEHYIILDCRYSELDYIKNSILNSKLNKLFDLSKIDWFKCEEFALRNIIKEVCSYWNDKEEWETTADLEKIFGLTRFTIIKYLKNGKKLGWCNYDPKEEMRKNAINNSKNKCHPVIVYKNNKLMGVFESGSDLERKSKELFGVKLTKSGIAQACRGEINTYKGFVIERTPKKI